LGLRRVFLYPQGLKVKFPIDSFSKQHQFPRMCPLPFVQCFQIVNIFLKHHRPHHQTRLCSDLFKKIRFVYFFLASALDFPCTAFQSFVDCSFMSPKTVFVSSSKEASTKKRLCFLWITNFSFSAVSVFFYVSENSTRTNGLHIHVFTNVQKTVRFVS
jgi:hypothetical protein